MNFYLVDDVSSKSVTSSGMSVSIMIQVYDILSKKSPFKTMDDLVSYDLVYLENGTFLSQEGLAFLGKNKKEQFALVKPGNIFTVTNKINQFSAQVFENQLIIAPNLTSLHSICKSPDLSKLNEIEQKAHTWLNSDKTGISSLTICKTLLPNLKHYKLLDLNSLSHPHDTSDFNRCLNFFECVPELKSQLSSMSAVSDEWKNLVEHWNDIEHSFYAGKSEEAYDLIKKSISSKSLKPK